MIERVLQEFWPAWKGEIRSGPSGWNNTTHFIDHPSGQTVLRIYNTHRDKAKIEFELAVLASLRQLPLSYKVPLPLRTASGEQIAQIQDGSERYAVLFSYIEGERPEASNVQAAYSLGEKSGELVQALAHIRVANPVVYPPYYELLRSYPACTEAFIRGFCDHPAPEFSDLREQLGILKAAYLHIMIKLDLLRNLPQQLVHGDLNYSNLLVDPQLPGNVTALLDFEFCTRDVRAMEPAVIISGLLGSEVEIEAVRMFCQGFGSHMRLTLEELKAIPVLIRLRMVDIFLHFTTRYLEGIDDASVLRRQISILAGSFERLDQSSVWVEALMEQYLV
ncbi:hypothetical protein JCM10914A_40930 [Paenibacillus sp. JCM 10914]|uniref:phosphotransferase n=1 Tax=Paenibacillus sp. JCM 10914 TaxID=1236974 RepID=UPI0003CC7E73|nr:phosphotransferase [Paenibacillus sp. JCM 10914]GAE05306.1 predicted protein [Paenibacillus sp. JCM 10914]